MTRRKTTDEFINNAWCVHGDTYNYKLVDYRSNRINVDIICSIHGVFNQKPGNHTILKQGCPKCGVISQVRSRTLDVSTFFKRSYDIHGDLYGYGDVIYKNIDTKVMIRCHRHGVFDQTPYKHLLGRGCQKCAGQYKERYASSNIPVYDIYHPQLEPYGIKCRRSPDDENVLEVRCMYCDRWYIPTRSSVTSKINSINGGKGESNLYCSNSCKQSCPTYNQNKYPKGHGKQSTSREVQPQLRKLVLLRDDYSCQRCGATDKQLHCHHIDPVKNNQIESADVDNCLTLCIDCHKLAHKDDGCKYSDLSNC